MSWYTPTCNVSEDLYQLVVFKLYVLIYELVDVKVYVSYENIHFDVYEFVSMKIYFLYENIQFDVYEFVSMKIYFLANIQFLAYQLD